MKLVIVESPAKAKTIAKYLGDGYVVDASKGHVVDLPQKTLAIDIKNNYEPSYEIIDSQKDRLKSLAEKVKKADCVYLATDPDREGEAISWHLQNALKLDKTQKNRIMFNEISKKAVQNAIDNPDYINMNLVNAQQARRVLDRLVGYKVSPVLCKKISPRLSAGRVQSSALKIIVDREREIKNFKPEEYWTVTAELLKQKYPSFKASLNTFNNKKLKISSQSECDNVLSNLNGDYVVKSVKKSLTTSSPYAPFTTSTLQQDAVNKLKITSKVCMSLAQQLYEGIEIDGEHVALVTYIRTDSVRVSLDAINSARDYLLSVYGEKYVPAKPNYYSSKKAAQDAHEAIRPINVTITPEYIKTKVSKGLYSLYKLIYERFLASQSTKAEYDSVAVIVDCNNYGFKANGKTVRFDGYTRIYNDNKTDESEDNAKIPPLDENEILKLVDLKHEQKFTKGPLRYTESSIIKTMEENGIGRPSTFSAILTTLYNRNYVIKDGKALLPTDLGFAVTEYMEKYFSDIVDVEFTAGMEDKLDTIEENSADWRKIVDDFYTPMEAKIKEANKSDIVSLPDEPSNVTCENCGAPMVIKMGRFGKYLACSNYPECKTTKSLKKTAPEIVTDEICELCGGKLVERESRYGKYLACSNYPTCKFTKSISQVVGTCPKCGKDLIKRISKRGKVFYGCSGYPNCDYVSWDLPAPKKCPTCGSDMVVKDLKSGKKYKCVNKDCGYVEEVNEG